MSTNIALKYKVKGFYDIQRLRIAAENRKKKAGLTALHLDQADIDYFASLSKSLNKLENEAKNAFLPDLLKSPIYTQFLSKLSPAIAEGMSGVLLSEIDIARATTVSKIWAVCGIGMEREWMVTYKQRTRKIPELGETAEPESEDDLEEIDKAASADNDDSEQSETGGWSKWSKWKTVNVWATSVESVKSVIPRPKNKQVEREWQSVMPVGEKWDIQRRREGQGTSYNCWLKTKVLGVIATNIIKAGGIAKKSGKPLSPFLAKYLKVYYDYKNRMLSAGFVEQQKEEGKEKGILGHLDKMAKRKMIKEFFKDYYQEGRTAMGYPKDQIRRPYQEEYLHHFHKEEGFADMGKAV